MDDIAILITKIQIEQIISELNKIILNVGDGYYNNKEFINLKNKLDIIVDFLLAFEVNVTIYQKDHLYDYVLQYDFTKNDVDTINNYTNNFNNEVYTLSRKSSGKIS